MRIVVDTNVVISGVFFGGMPRIVTIVSRSISFFFVIISNVFALSILRKKFWVTHPGDPMSEGSKY